MKFTVFPSLLLFAPIMGQSSVKPLEATVGGSVQIMCSLSGYPLRWFYWQEDKSDRVLYNWDINGTTQSVADRYKNRVHALNTDFRSGNISIRLDNVTVGDEKTLWAYVGFYDEQGTVPKQSEQGCESKLQVSAPYRDLNLTVNYTANRATCTAQGGYPEPQVSWTGRNKSSAAQLDLQDAETSLQQDPTEKTFSVTSSVSVKELQSVTCLVRNPRSNQRIHKTSEIEAPDENQQIQRSYIATVVPSVIAVIIIMCVFLWKKYNPGNRSHRPEHYTEVETSSQLERESKVTEKAPDGDDDTAPQQQQLLNQLAADSESEEKPESSSSHEPTTPEGAGQSPQQTENLTGGDSAEGNSSDAPLKESGGNESEANVTLSGNQAVFKAPHAE